jgi:integrase
MSRALTDSVVKNLKPRLGRSAWIELSDAGCRGLCLRLSPRGEKIWAVRHTVGGKRQRHTVGAYPAVSLSAARDRAREYLAAAKDAVSAAEVDARTRALTLTVAGAHQEYIASLGASLRSNTKALKEAMFRDHVKPEIGDRLVRTVRRKDVIGVVTSVVAKGFPVQANRVFSEVMALLRWCEQKGYVEGVPSLRKKDLWTHGAAKEQARRRMLADAEIAEVWKTAASLGAKTGDYIRIVLLLGQRRDEVRLMTRAEVDLDQALWTIPKERYKTKVDHAVPLPPHAVEILRRRLQETSGDFVFAARNPERPFNGTASALRRLRKRMDNRLPFTLHDLRRTCRTTLSRLGFDEETAELVIGHLPQGMAKTYNLYDRLPERRAALVRWAQFVLSLADGKVVSIGEKGAA